MNTMQCPGCKEFFKDVDGHKCEKFTFDPMERKSFRKGVLCPDCRTFVEQDAFHACGDTPETITVKKNLFPKANTRTKITQINEGYLPLYEVLEAALEQAQNGKGSARHGSSKPFSEQPMMRISEQFGDGFPLGQAFKKLEESMRMDKDSAIRERRGAINYITGSILLMQREEMGTPGGVTLTDDDFRPIMDEKSQQMSEKLKNISPGPVVKIDKDFEPIPIDWTAFCYSCNKYLAPLVMSHDAVGVRMLGDKCSNCGVTGSISYTPVKAQP